MINYYAAIIMGWEASDLRQTIEAYENSNTMYKFAEKIETILDETEHINDGMCGEFLYIGKIISNVELNSMPDVLHLNKTDLQLSEKLAYHEAAKLKEFWSPKGEPTLIHFCYAT